MNTRLQGLVVVLGLLCAALPGAMAQEPGKGPAPENENELRFQIMPHNFMVNGVEQEIFLKLDRYTGKTWRFHASNPRWTVIQEPASGHPRESGKQLRYELYAHDYFDQNGDEQELCLRADLVTGYSWTYRGASGAWKDVEQDE
jgi:hypothetical protein